MSRKIVEEIVLKAKNDSTFMTELLENPEKMVEGYELTEEELQFFKNADQKTLEGLSSNCFKLADKE